MCPNTFGSLGNLGFGKSWVGHHFLHSSSMLLYQLLVTVGILKVTVTKYTCLPVAGTVGILILIQYKHVMCIWKVGMSTTVN